MEGERAGATPSLRPPGVIGERRKRLRRGPNQGKVVALSATIALAGIERREGWRRWSCCDEEARRGGAGPGVRKNGRR
ncbi:hypothetical protein JCGZ_10378 [Jatropha curcas]|uniref:Uncharacterized protein n=1 Tax=Jatropha curcas TaxID=180498 RepID=A0A067KU61_JATCU|nr:hypothetical protein JCGZ_10378 [Jatropha curcas]